MLAGPEPVRRWLRGTGARAPLDASPETLRPASTAALRGRRATAYPRQGWGTVPPSRRLFVMAHRGNGRPGAGRTESAWAGAEA